jgi:hypothetical protein
MADLTQEELAKYLTGINGAKTAQEIDTTKSGKAIAIIGEPKTGKSWLAASIGRAVGPTFVFDLDNRMDSIAGKPNIIGKTYVDETQINPHAMRDILIDLENFKYRKTCGEPIPVAYIVDSVTFLKRIVENQFFKENETNNALKMFHAVKLQGKNEVRIPIGYDSINGVRDFCIYLFSELRALGHLIVIFHERPITDKKLSTPQRPVYTGKIGVDPPYLNGLLTTFNDVWRIVTDSAGNYKVFVKPAEDFNGATTLRGLEPIEDPDIAAMLQKNAAALAKQ